MSGKRLFVCFVGKHFCLKESVAQKFLESLAIGARANTRRFSIRWVVSTIRRVIWQKLLLPLALNRKRTSKRKFSCCLFDRWHITRHAQNRLLRFVKGILRRILEDLWINKCKHCRQLLVQVSFSPGFYYSDDFFCVFLAALQSSVATLGPPGALFTSTNTLRDVLNVSNGFSNLLTDVKVLLCCGFIIIVSQK